MFAVRPGLAFDAIGRGRRQWVESRSAHLCGGKRFFSGGSGDIDFFLPSETLLEGFEEVLHLITMFLARIKYLGMLLVIKQMLLE